MNKATIQKFFSKEPDKETIEIDSCNATSLVNMNLAEGFKIKRITNVEIILERKRADRIWHALVQLLILIVILAVIALAF